ncbi:MAG: AAA family ATPase [Caldiserica bacterium]|nr:AAA family ATPase [Caldisericota bacterium]MDH7562113.1 AAA family ATPase [Caldisericota bacterium]
MAKVIALANQKGGVGKTTTAVNLGAALAHLGCKTLVVDLDPQGNATIGLGVDRSKLDFSVYQILLDEVSPQEVILPTRYPGLFLIPSTIELAGAEIELVALVSREYRLQEALKEIKSGFDFVLLDCPPSLGLLTINAMTAADSILIPIQCEFYALEGVTQLLNTINLVRRRLNPNLELEGVLLTMFDGRTTLSQDVERDVRSVFEGKVFRANIPRSVRLAEAPSHGKSILDYEPHSKGAQAYLTLAKEVLEK